MLNQKNRNYFLLYSLVVLLLPITTLAQTLAVPTTSIIPAPPQTDSPPDGIAASGDGQVITSAWVGSNTLFVRIATLSGETWQVQQTTSQSGVIGTFATSVAINNDGSIIAAGDPNQDQVFIYSRESATGMWSLATSITGTGGHQFGNAVALDDTGSILAVAAPRDLSNRNADNTGPLGAVYIFEQSGGNWMERTIIRPANRSLDFARDIALSGNGLILAIGVGFELSGGDIEEVHLFSRAATADVGTWGEPDIITASDSFAGDGFGDEIALNTAGNILAVGARRQNNLSDGTNGLGAVYIFQRGNEVGASWQEQQKIKPSGQPAEPTAAAISFGASIDLNGAGDRLVVGAVGATNFSGATYLYDFNEVSGNLSELNLILGGDGLEQGEQVALNNEYLVTSEFDATFAPQLLVVQLDSVVSDLIINPESLSIAAGGTETVEVNLESDPASPVTLTVTSNGKGLTINGMEIAEAKIVVSSSAVQIITVGADSDIVSGEQILTFSADGYVSKQLTVTILPVTSIIPAPMQAGGVPDGIAASGDGQVITSAWVGSNTLFVSIVTLSGETWQVQQTTSQSEVIGAVDTSVAINNDGSIIAAGNPNQDEVFIYSRESATGMWSLATSISITIIGTHQFGNAVALNDTGSILAVAAPLDPSNRDTDNTGPFGAVYIFERSGENWMQRTIIRPANRSLDFARDIALSGNGLILAIGVGPQDGISGGDIEEVHLFSRAATADVGTWGEPDIVTASDSFAGDGFGDEIALNTAGNILAVGARRQNNLSDGTNGLGAVYIFQRGNEVGASWQEQQKIKPSGQPAEPTAAAIQFGASIDLNGAGDRLVVGAPDATDFNGATYLYGFNEVSGNWSELNLIPGGDFSEQGVQVALNNEYLVTAEFAADDRPQLLVVQLDSVVSDLIINPESLSIAASDTETVEVNLESEPASPVTLTVTSNGEGLTLNGMEIVEILVSSLEVQTITVVAAADIVSGEQTLTFSADGYASKQLPVTISNTSLLGRLVLPDTMEIREGDMAISVLVATNPVQNAPLNLEARVVATGQNADDLSFPQFNSASSSTPLQTLIDDGMEIEVMSDGIYTGDREIVVTLSATRYESAEMFLTIIDSSLDTPPVITVNSTSLSVSRGTSTELEVRIDAPRERILSVPVTAGEAITVSPAVLEFGIGETVTTLTVTATALTEDTYEPYRISLVSFDIPGNPPEVEVLIDGQFNVVESTDSTFGRSIALSGNDQVMAVGTVSGAGSVDVYTNNGSGYWEFAQTLTASNAETNDKFGSAIAISDDGSTIAISAPEEDSIEMAIVTGTAFSDDNNEPSDRNAGAVYIFTRGNDGQWTQQTYIKASNASAGANFGVSLALSDSGDILAVGADKETAVTKDPQDNPLATGAVYLFRYEGSWSEANNLKLAAHLIGGTNIDGISSEFGTNVALSGDGMTLAVGSPISCYEPSGISCVTPNDGTVYVFTSDSVDWSASSVQPPVPIRNNSRGSGRSNVGSSVELNRDGTTLAVGISNELVGGNQRQGAVDIFTKENDLWEHRQQITVPSGETGDRFGADVTMNSIGTVLAIGAPGDDSGAGGIYQSEDFSFDNNDIENVGAVYLYRLDDASGMYQHLLSVKPGVMTRAELEYGTAISLSAGDRGRGSLAIGAAGLFEIIPYSEGLVIVADPDEFDLDEGSSRTISVNLSQIGDTEVTVNLAVLGEGLVVSTSVLTFRDTAPQNVVVTATDNSAPSDDSTAIVTLSATDYPMERVTVNIIEDDLRPLIPTVEPIGDLILSVLAATQIEVTVDTEVDLLSVETMGSLSLSADTDNPLNSREFRDLAADTTIMIDIFSGTQLGDGTVKLTFSGDRLQPEVRTIVASVMSASLIIESVDTLTVTGGTSESLLIEVVGSAIFNEDINVRFEIEETESNLLTVTGSAADTLVNLPSGRSAQRSYSLARITGSSGDTTLRVTASAPTELSGVIAEATKDIRVRVNLPPIGLMVTPPSLLINLGTTETLTVSAPPGIFPELTIPADDPFNIVSLMSNRIDLQRTEIEVRGDATGQTTLTIVARIFDRNTETVDVIVVVGDFNIEVPDTLTLVEGGGPMDLNVGLAELRDPAGVTVNIEPTGLLGVSSSSLTFMNTNEQTIEVTTTREDDSAYQEPRVETLTLSAPGYTTATVTVTIIDNERLITLGIEDGDMDIDLPRFTSASITVQVDSSDPTLSGVTLNVATEGAVTLAGNTDLVMLPLSDGQTSAEIEISGTGIGLGTVMFMASGTDVVSDPVVVNVTVSTPALVISAVNPSAINLLTSETTNLEVTVSAAFDSAVGNPDVMIMGAVTGGNADIVMSLGDTTGAANMPVIFTVSSSNTPGNATITLTASNDNYILATEVVPVNVNLRDIGLMVNPSDDQDLVRFEDLAITVEADQNSTLSIVAEGSAVSVVGTESRNLSANTLEQVEIRGDNIGVSTVTFTVSSPGFADAVETVRVTVRTPTLMFSPAIATNIELVVGDEMDLSVAVAAESGDAMGGVTLTATVTAGTVDTVTVSPLEMLNVPLAESRIFTVGSGDEVGNAMIRITASHPDYEDAIAEVSVNVLSELSIGTDVDTLNVTEGDSADILVSLSRIESGNVVVTVTTEGDVTVPQELTFSSPAGQRLTVGTTEIPGYAEARSATVTLSATGYTTRTVIVSITDSELPPIGLVVDPSDDQDLARFMDLEIGVTADQDSTLSIVTEGGVSVVGAGSRNLSANTSEQVEIRGDNIGVSTVTFTVSSPGFADAVETVRVTVRTPTLMFSPAIATNIELVVGDEMDLSVAVAAESGDAMGGVTLTATVTAGTVDTVTVSPLEMLNVPLAESRIFTVDGGDNVGDAMIRITASHPDYEDAIAEVSVNVLSELSIGTDVDTLNVTEGDSADILVSLSRIESGNVVVTVTTEGDVTVPQELTFSSPAGQTLTVGTTEIPGYAEARSATVTLSATGYTTRTVRVSITERELPPIGLVLDPSDDQDLLRFMDLEIGVTADQDSTLSIVTEGGVSVVGSASRDLSANNEVPIEITGSNIGVGTVTFTVSSPGFADAVETVRVTVRTPMLMFSPAIATNIELVVGDEMDLSVAVAAESGDAMGGVTLTATVTAGTVDTVTVSPLEMLNVPLAESRIFTVGSGDEVGNAMIRITASHPDYEDAIAEVSVNVLSELSIGTDVDTLNVTEGDSADILVSLSRIESGNVVVTVTTEGDVTAPQELTFSSPAGQTLTVGTTEIPGYAEARSATVRLTATGYTTRTVIVSITERELPPIGLELDPSGDQDLLRFMDLEIGVTADQDSTLSIVTEGAVSLVDPASASPQDLSANSEVPIEITGSNIGVGTVTFTVSSPGFADAVETVRVTVRTPMLMFSPAIATNIELVVGEEMDLSVAVAAESGDAMGGVTLTATVTAGTVDTVTVSPLEMLNVPLAESRIFTVDGGDNVGDAMIRITASHPDYEDAIAEVSVNVLSELSIGTDVDTLNVTEGDSADIQVSLSRIESGNVVVTVTTEGDVTAPQELTFSSPAGQTLTVGTTEIPGYAEARSATVTLSATGYTTRTVRVSITERELPPIGLVLDPSGDQDLARFMDLEIGVTADQDSTLSIVTEGGVSVVGAGSRDLSADTPEQVEIRGETIGVSTVTFTVSSPGFADAVETVMVTVRTPMLMFSPAIATNIELVVGEEMDLSVAVAAESGDVSEGVTLTATVTAGTASGVMVDPAELLNVALNDPQTFTVGSGDEVGNAMIRITASHPDYEDAIVEVSVNVLSELSIGTDVDTLNVTEGDSADIQVSLSRIESGNVTVRVETDGDVTVSSGELTFSSPAGQTLTVGTTEIPGYAEARSATVTLSATGYTTRTVRVSITDSELPPIGLELDPSGDQDLARFMDLEIGVTADQDSTLSIVTEGAVSLVDPASASPQDLSANSEVPIEITGSNIGVGTVTFTVSSPGFADAVETVRVTVRTPMLMFSPAIATNIELVVGEEMDLSVAVAAESGDVSEGVTLTATVTAGTASGVMVDPAELLNVALNDPQTFTVGSGDEVGNAMIRITASHPDYEDAIAEVSVNVLSELSIGTDVDTLNVTEGDSADILVSLSRIESGNVVVTVTTEGDVTAPQELTFSSPVGQTLTVGTTEIPGYAEARSATVTLSATGYTTRTVRVSITDSELPPIGLELDPSDDQDLLRFMDLEIGVTADRASTLSIVTEGGVSVVGTAPRDLSANDEVQVEIRGDDIGVGTVTFTVSSPGFADAVETVRVTVRTPMLMFSPAIATNIELVAGGATADLSVAVTAEAGEISEGVTLTATVTAGTVDTVTVSPLEMLNVPLAESRIFTVGSGDNVGDATVTITASHPDYEDAIAEVSVNVLSMFRIGTDVDRLNVTEGDRADINVSLSRIESGNVVVTVTTEGDVTAPQELTFSSTAGQTLTVEAIDIDMEYTEDRSATVTLSATGYTTRTVRVTIMDDELPPIGLMVDPSDDQDLLRFTSLAIGVEADRASTLGIVTEGGVSVVGAGSRNLSADTPEQVEISGDNIGVSTVTFTVSSPGFADAVETVRVTVRTPSLMFSQVSDTIELVAGGTMADLSVEVAAESGDVSEGVTLTATVIAGTVDTVTVDPSEMLNVPLGESRMFTVGSGDNVGDAMIRITASHPDYEDAIAEVSVNVLSMFRIGTDVDRLSVTEGDSADILVSLSRIDSGDVVVTVTTEGDVTAPQELTFSSTAGQTLTVGTTEIPGYAEARSATVTLTATDYTTRTVIVTITDSELQPIGLELDPLGDQDLARFMNLAIGVTADQASTLSIATEGAVSLVGSASRDLSANTEVPIEITGSNIGVGTVTFTVSSPGFADAVETVRVTVRTPRLMFSQVSDTINLVVGGTTANLSVTVAAEAGEISEGVTLTATVITGTVDTVTVSPLEMLNVPLAESRIFTVDGGDNVGDAMIRITASHPDYEDAIAEVRVNVSAAALRFRLKVFLEGAQ